MFKNNATIDFLIFYISGAIMKTLVVLFGLLASTYAVSFFEVVLEEWEAWKVIHRKSYNNTEEEKFRMKIFMENKQRIAKHNTRYFQGHHSYKLEMNHYGDLLPHEFAGTYNTPQCGYFRIFLFLRFYMKSILEN